uniref:Putative peptidase n=1 Tax=viral metagenome TaxID=1070528 RepID=A0A6M3JUD0_9ZZZZ
MNWLSKFFGGTVERPSPTDWLPEGVVRKWADSIPWESLNLGVALSQKPKVWVPMIPDTNSMDGVFDYGNNNILIAGANEIDHKIIVRCILTGDIAVYRTSTTYAIHRVIAIGYDAKGKYFRFKGDNNFSTDPGRVRESEIEWVSIGVIY